VRVAQPLTRISAGALAEQLAAEHLKARGLSVLARNLRCRAGEIDLICLDAQILAIVEVRQRRRVDFGGALGSVTWRKQRKIIRAARYLLRYLTTCNFGRLAAAALPAFGAAGGPSVGSGSASPSGKIIPWPVSRA